MVQFAVGLIIGLLITAPFFLWLLLRRPVRHIPENGQSVTEKEINRPQRDLEELGKLTGGLAHEIKNPLSTIKVNLKLITEDLESRPGDLSNMGSETPDRIISRAVRKIAVVQKETDRVERILEGFLRYVDRTKLQMTDSDINALAGDMIDFYSPQAHSHSIRVRQGLYKEQLVCKVDAGMLKQVLLNLFINAQQAMNDGGELMIKTDRQENDAIIQISDTGCGIAPDKLPRIFDAYYSSRQEGSGLGLPTARRIIEDHKGTITVDSELSKGTSFTIKLPLKVN
ncbi:MAG: sensor histidine kinase [Planctomycetota bacterium]